MTPRGPNSENEAGTQQQRASHQSLDVNLGISLIGKNEEDANSFIRMRKLRVSDLRQMSRAAWGSRSCLSMEETWVLILWVLYEDTEVELDRKFDDGKIPESKGRCRIESVTCHSIAQNETCFCEPSRELACRASLWKSTTLERNWSSWFHHPLAGATPNQHNLDFKSEEGSKAVKRTAR